MPQGSVLSALQASVSESRLQREAVDEQFGNGTQANDVNLLVGECIAYVLKRVDEVVNTPSTIFLLLVATLLYTLHRWPVWNRASYPPGPLPLPFLGHSHWFYTCGNLFKKIYELKDKYGEVITLDVNEGKLVILNSAEAIQEAFVKQASIFSERPDFLFNPSTGGLGLVHEKNGRWKDLRKHALRVFRHHGVGSRGIEEVIQEELKHFLLVIQRLKGKPMDIKELMTQAISNIMTSIVFGRRFDYTADQLANLQITEFRDIFEKTKFIPFMRNAPFDPVGYQAAKKRQEAGVDFARRQVESHRKDVDIDSPRDYIDYFLLEQKRRENDPCSQFTDLNLITSVMSLYMAGTDTTSSQLYWAFLYMVLYPEIQARIYQEIKEHIGERQAEYADRTRMHYTMSVMTELLRIGIALNSLLHTNTEDAVVRGQKIPKGTPIFANTWGPLHNPEVYPDPETFKPDRFLNEEGVFVKPDPKHFTTFSAGKRVCLGEPLARTEIFLTLVTILQHYELSLGQDKRPSERGMRWFVWVPADRYKLSFQPR